MSSVTTTTTKKNKNNHCDKKKTTVTTTDHAYIQSELGCLVASDAARYAEVAAYSAAACVLDLSASASKSLDGKGKYITPNDESAPLRSDLACFDDDGNEKQAVQLGTTPKDKQCPTLRKPLAGFEYNITSSIEDESKSFNDEGKDTAPDDKSVALRRDLARMFDVDVDEKLTGEEAQHDAAVLLADLLKGKGVIRGLNKRSYTGAIEKRLCSFANHCFVYIWTADKSSDVTGDEARSINGETNRDQGFLKGCWRMQSQGLTGDAARDIISDETKEKDDRACLKGWFWHIVPRTVCDGATLKLGLYTIHFEAVEKIVTVKVTRNGEFEGSPGLLTDVHCQLSVAKDGCSLSVIHCANEDIDVNVHPGRQASHLTKRKFLQKVGQCQIKNRCIDYLEQFQSKAVNSLGRNIPQSKAVNSLGRNIQYDLNLNKHPQTGQIDGANFKNENRKLNKEETNRTESGYPVLDVDCTIPKQSLHKVVESGVSLYGESIRVEAGKNVVVTDVKNEWVEETGHRNLEFYLKIGKDGTISCFAKRRDGRNSDFFYPKREKTELTLEDWQKGPGISKKK